MVEVCIAQVGLGLVEKAKSFALSIHFEIERKLFATDAFCASVFNWLRFEFLPINADWSTH